eukprot:1161277-Pelagomonas_calceolata.AAC.10
MPLIQTVPPPLGVTGEVTYSCHAVDRMSCEACVNSRHIRAMLVAGCPVRHIRAMLVARCPVRCVC